MDEGMQDAVVTQKIDRMKQISKAEQPIAETAILSSSSDIRYEKQVSHAGLHSISKRDIARAQMLQERCRQLCLSVFFREHAPVRSLGFTSSLVGEGKSFLAVVTAGVLSDDSSSPVTLLECNW